MTVFGIWLANQDELEIDSVLEFKEDLSMILISSLFILLAARLQLSDLMMLHSDVFIFLAIVLLWLAQRVLRYLRLEPTYLLSLV